MKSKNLKITKNCEVCNNSDLIDVLNLGLYPLCDDLIKINNKTINKKYPIEIIFCKVCKTAHQKFQVDKKKLFPTNYHYRASMTKDVIKGMEGLFKSSNKLIKNFKNKIVLDIGCNDGSLLKFYKNKGAITIGVEPTEAIKDAKFIDQKFQKYFNKSVADKIKKKNKYIDLITFTNVFAHIDNLNELLKNLKILIDEKTLIIIENHYLGSILKYNQFDTFYHEHPRTYSLESFKYIAQKLDMKILRYSLPKRYGGNIRVYFKKNNKMNYYKNVNELNFEKKFIKMNNFINKWKVDFRKKIIKLNKIYGPLRAKAFPGRASILVNALDLNSKNIKGVYEKSDSLKVNHYLPGTRIKILNDDTFNYSDESPIVNFAWHINDEIKKYLRSKGFNGKIIPIIKK